MSKLPVPQRPRWPSDLAQKGEQAVASPSVRSGPIPTPLYVTQHGKGVMLKFKTQEEADAAWRMLSALAEAHADRTHKEQQLECKHAYEALDDKCFVCTLCGHMT